MESRPEGSTGASKLADRCGPWAGTAGAGGWPTSEAVAWWGGTFPREGSRNEVPEGQGKEPLSVGRPRADEQFPVLSCLQFPSCGPLQVQVGFIQPSTPNGHEVCILDLDFLYSHYLIALLCILCLRHTELFSVLTCYHMKVLLPWKRLALHLHP